MKNLIKNVLRSFVNEQMAMVKPNLNKIIPAKYGKQPVSEFVSGGYSANGVPRAYDALHSFQGRASDGFGGKLNTIVNNAVKKFKTKHGIKNVDIRNLKVYINPQTLKVDWILEITEGSGDYSYEQIDSRGSAGGGENAVNGQISGMHGYHSNKKPVQILHFNKTIPKCFDSNGNKLKGGCKGTINIQQKFFKYGKKVK